jgi:hypothetical protein
VLHLTIDAALNLLWLGISVISLVAFWGTERRRPGLSARRGRFLRLFSVCLVAVALFPSVSDSDDLFNFSLMQMPGRGGVGSAPLEDSKEKDSLHLASLLETLDHYSVTSFYTFALALFCFAFLAWHRTKFYTRTIRCRSGRAPPFA